MPYKNENKLRSAEKNEFHKIADLNSIQKSYSIFEISLFISEQIVLKFFTGFLYI